MSYKQSKEIHREFKVAYALTSYQICPICKQHVQKADITLISERIIKYPVVNQITKKYYHLICFNEKQLYKTSNKIAPVECVNGYEILTQQDKQILRDYINSLQIKIIKKFPNLEETYLLLQQQQQVNNHNNQGNHQRQNVNVSGNNRQPQALLNSNKINTSKNKIDNNNQNKRSTWNNSNCSSSEEKKNHQQQTLLQFSSNRKSQENKVNSEFLRNYQKKLDFQQSSEKKDDNQSRRENNSNTNTHRFVSTSEKLEQLKRQQKNNNNNIENQYYQEGKIVKKTRLDNGVVVIEHNKKEQEQIRRNNIQKGDSKNRENISNDNSRANASTNNQQGTKLNLIHKAPRLSNDGVSYNSIPSNLSQKRPLVSFEVNSMQSKEQVQSEMDRQLKQIEVSQKYILVQLLENNGYLNVRNLSSQWLVCLAKDGVINGAIPHCPICNDGQLIHNKIKDEYFCTGSTDKSCKRAFNSQEIHRKKWNQLCM